jgi:hypothetical protein
MTDSSRVVIIDEPMGGWFAPWPNVFELSTFLSEENWIPQGMTLHEVGSLQDAIAVTRRLASTSPRNN